MAFSFGTTFAPPESPVELRQTTYLTWSDSAVTIDTWLVEIYSLRMNGTTIGDTFVEAYVAPVFTPSNFARIDLKDFVFPLAQTELWYASISEGHRASITTAGVKASDLATGYQLQVYSVTNGVKSALQGELQLHTSQQHKATLGRREL